MLQKDKNNTEIAMQIRYHEMLSRKTADNFMLGFRLSKADSVELVAVAISGTTIGNRAKYWLSFFYPTYTFNIKVKAYQLPDYNKIDCDATKSRKESIGTQNIVSYAVPNPTTGKVEIYYTLPQDVKEGKIEIIDNISGTVFQSKSVNNQSNSIVFDLSDLTNGMYHYRLFVGNAVIHTQKIILLR